MRLDEIINLAQFYHGKQLRRYTHTPYIAHPCEVMGLVAGYYKETHPFENSYEHILMACVLHDVIEDCHVTPEELILKRVPIPVVRMVEGLTDASLYSDRNRATRKEMDRVKLSEQSFDVQFIKCADMISNSLDINLRDRNFAKIYMKEKELLLQSLLKVVTTPIYDKAYLIVEDYRKDWSLKSAFVKSLRS